MRGEKYLASIQNVYLLLCDIAENPKDYISDEKWMVMVQTIFTMCAFDDPTLNIAKCAPNTFKRNATNTILGGFPEVDRQRKLAKESLAKASVTKVLKKPGSRRAVAKKTKIKNPTTKVRDKLCTNADRNPRSSRTFISTRT